MSLTCKLAELLFVLQILRKKKKRVFPLSHSTDIGEFSPSLIGQRGNVKLRYTLAQVWRSAFPDSSFHLSIPCNGCKRFIFQISVLSLTNFMWESDDRRGEVWVIQSIFTAYSLIF